MERITFSTDDGITIVGDLYKAKEGSPCALLLHMMPATKESWATFAARLVDEGFTVLAIDLRGHGESSGTATTPLDYKTFTDEAHRATIHDVEAAVRWLIRTQSVKDSRIAIVGASIGANLAIAFAAKHRPPGTVVALSPGLVYHGVNTETAIYELAAMQKLYLAASDDDEYSFSSVRELAAMRPKMTILKELHNAGHGTTMLEKSPEFLEEVVQWVSKNVK